MMLDKETGKTEHHVFREIIDELNPGDCLVINDTKVIPARLIGAKEDTGAKIEVLLLKRGADDVWETLVKPGKKGKTGGKNQFWRRPACRRSYGCSGGRKSSDPF